MKQAKTTAKRMGRPPKAVVKGSVTARIDPSLVERLEAEAAREERSVSYLVERAVKERYERIDVVKG